MFLLYDQMTLKQPDDRAKFGEANTNPHAVFFILRADYLQACIGRGCGFFDSDFGVIGKCGAQIRRRPSKTLRSDDPNPPKKS